MTSNVSPRFEFDDDDRQFMADVGLPSGGDAPFGACPPLSLLLAADESALPGDTQGAIATHLAGCAFCRSLVQDVKEAGLGGPTSEEDERVRARVRALVAPTPQVSPAKSRSFAMPGGLALAASAVLVAGLGWYARSQQQRVTGLEQTLAPLRAVAEQHQQRVAVLERQLAALQAQVDRPVEGQPNVPVVDLEPVGTRRVAETVRTFPIPSGARFVTVILQLDAGGGADGLSAEVRDAGGELRWSTDGLRASSLGVVTVLVPRSSLPDGDVAITLVRVREGRRVTLAEYRARFDRV